MTTATSNIESQSFVDTFEEGRLKDLADVQELIKIRGLGSEFAEELNPYTREILRTAGRSSTRH